MSKFRTMGKRCRDGKIFRPRLHRVWATMRTRCTNPNNENYRWYGARGISVCAEWRKFAPFRAWAVSNGYQKGMVLDRIDSDGPYSPDNCRWILNEQNHPNRKLTRTDVQAIRASDLPISDLAKIYQVYSSHIVRIQQRQAWKKLPEAPPLTSGDLVDD